MRSSSASTAKSPCRRTSLACALVLGAWSVSHVRSQITPYPRSASARAAAQKLPNPVADAVRGAARALAVTQPAEAPAALLERARTAMRDGTPIERATAAVLLGSAGKLRDRSVLLAAFSEGNAEDPSGDPARVGAHAIIGLGLLGGSASRLQLARLLSDKGSTRNERIMAALALGLAATSWADRARGDSSSGEITARVLHLLRRNRDRYVNEIAACFVALPADEGRGLLVEFLKSNEALPNRVVTVTRAIRSIRGLALAQLGRRFGSDEEWVLLRAGLQSARSPMRRYLTAWGLARHTGSLDDRRRERVVRLLVRRLQDNRPEVSAMALLALARFDSPRAARQARAVFKRARQPDVRRGAAFLVLGEHGTASDIALFERQVDRDLGVSARAGWCIGAARLARRITPEAWPVGDGDAVAFPIPDLRLQLRVPTTPTDLVTVAAAVGLARLGDTKSALTIRDRLYATSRASDQRVLALAALRLDPRAMDERPASIPGSLPLRQMQAWSYASAPQLWTPLLALVSSADTSPEDRARGFRLAAIAVAGTRAPSLWLREQVGPSPIPPAIQELARF